MIEKSTTQKVLELFFENPSREFHLRELSRLTKISLPWTRNVILELKGMDLVIVNNERGLTLIKSNKDSLAN